MIAENTPSPLPPSRFPPLCFSIWHFITIHLNVFTCSYCQFYKSQQLTALLQPCLVLTHFSQRTRTTYITSILQMRTHYHTWIRGHHRSFHRSYITSKLQSWLPLPRNIARLLRHLPNKPLSLLRIWRLRVPYSGGRVQCTIQCSFEHDFRRVIHADYDPWYMH